MEKCWQARDGDGDSHLQSYAVLTSHCILILTGLQVVGIECLSLCGSVIFKESILTFPPIV